VSEPEDLPGLRQASPSEAALLLKAISSRYNPKLSTEPPSRPSADRQGLTWTIIPFAALALFSGIALSTIVFRRRRGDVYATAVGAP
jgi:hypothetical protein